MYGKRVRRGREERGMVTRVYGQKRAAQKEGGGGGAKFGPKGGESREEGEITKDGGYERVLGLPGRLKLCGKRKDACCVIRGGVWVRTSGGSIGTR